MSLVIYGATVIDGTGSEPMENSAVFIEDGRIAAVEPHCRDVPRDWQKLDAKNKYIIPGLMNSNVHLSFGMYSIERMARHLSYYQDNTQDIVAEAAQIALKNGLTTVFDTCGLRRALIAVRDDINAGKVVGSRIFCAGWIVGFDGLFSEDFMSKATKVLSGSYARRINAICVENVGRHLMWLPPDEIAIEVRNYISKGIDFLKYASNEHVWASAGAFLAFSDRAQEAIVAEAHQAGISAQAHTMSVEGLRIAVTSGCNLIQHANITGPVPIPEATLELMAKRGTGAVVFPFTEKNLRWVLENSHEQGRSMWHSSDVNTRNLIRSGAPLLLGNDGTVIPTEFSAESSSSKGWAEAGDDKDIAPLGTGHFAWFEAMEEKGCRPIDMLQAATKNIARAYGKDKELGTLEKGKIADLLILDKNPLEAASNYRSIHMVFKQGTLVDRDALPTKLILTRPAEAPAAEEVDYVPASRRRVALPMCPMCMGEGNIE